MVPTEKILCSNCHKPIDANGIYRCSVCGKFFCDNCTVEAKGKFTCVSCYSANQSKATRGIIDQILTRKGVKMELPKLHYKNMQIKEIVEMRIDKDRVELKLKCASSTSSVGVMTFPIDRTTFDQMWNQAIELGYKPERIPFGRRIVI